MRQAGWRLRAKRGFDVAASATLLVGLAPLLGATALGVRATMGSPVLFKQRRPGRDCEYFEMWKFRTMRHPAPGQEGPDADAARVTRFGTLLRKTSIDELPQLFNIFVGDMSLVGPRPFMMAPDVYTPEQNRRHDVLPGLTGWAQVNGRNSLSWEEKFEKDVWYVDHWSLRLDAKIVAKTVVQVLKREGIAAAGHATMPRFWGVSAAKPQATESK